jgi:type IV secretion system protein VirB10
MFATAVPEAGPTAAPGDPAGGAGSQTGSGSGDASLTRAAPRGTAPALDPNAEQKRLMAAGARSNSRMSLEAGRQLAEADPETAAQLAAVFSRAGAAPAGGQQRNGAPAGSTLGGGPPTAAPAPSPAPTPTPNSLFVSGPRPVDLSTVKTDTHEQFLARQRDAGEIGYEEPGSPTEVTFGSVIWVELYTDVNSDLPGAMRAMVTRPVFDSKTHSVEVIPVGAWVDGFYDSRIVLGESRLLAGFTRVVFPNGRKFRMGAQVAADPRGASGLPADVDTHSGKAFRSAFALGILGAGAQLLVPQGSVLAAPSIAQQILGSVGAQVGNATTQQVTQQLQQSPTLRVQHGYEFAILVTHDLPLLAYTEDR